MAKPNVTIIKVKILLLLRPILFHAKSHQMSQNLPRTNIRFSIIAPHIDHLLSISASALHTSSTSTSCKHRHRHTVIQTRIKYYIKRVYKRIMLMKTAKPETFKTSTNECMFLVIKFIHDRLRWFFTQPSHRYRISPTTEVF